MSGPDRAPAQAAAPAAEALQSAQLAGGKDWQVMKSWKSGVVRACRTKWDGESFQLTVQLVNRAELRKRGEVLGARSQDYDEWSNPEYAPIAAGSKQTLVDTAVPERPRAVELRAKVTKGEEKSAWSPVVRLDRLDVC